MDAKRAVFAPVARAAAFVLDRNDRLFRWYRDQSFRGKLFISEYLERRLRNGVHECDGLLYDFDFADSVQRSVYLRAYERDELAFLHRYIQPGWCCVDVGANIGVYTLNLSRWIGASGRVLAIEPSPPCFERLQRNVALNGVDNCTLGNFAVSARCEEVTFSLSPGASTGWGRVGEWEWSGGTTRVSARTFDSIIEESGVDRVDFLKVDIEGHELELLEGAAESLRQGRIDRMLIEYCGVSPSAGTLKEFAERIGALGFRPVCLNLAKLSAAAGGSDAHDREVLNLLFERVGLGDEATAGRG